MVVNEVLGVFSSQPSRGLACLEAMPHFFFHLENGETRLEDRRGVALPDAEAAWYQGYRRARDLVTTHGPDRRQWGDHRLEVMDERGGHVWTMALIEIVEVAA